MKAIILAAVCLCACASDGPAMSEGGAVELEEAISQWAAVFRTPYGCETWPAVVIESGATFRAHCVTSDQDPSSEVAGCLPLAVPGAAQTIVISEPYQWRAANIVTHEAMHWLSGCTGMDADRQFDHGAPEIWAAGGVLAATNDALGLPEQTGSTL